MIYGMSILGFMEYFCRGCSTPEEPNSPCWPEPRDANPRQYGFTGSYIFLVLLFNFHIPSINKK